MAQVAQLVSTERLGHWLLQCYPATHGVRTDKALYDHKHELAHLKERAQNKTFHKLCTYMVPNYNQLEFEVRVYLTYQNMVGGPL